MCYKVTVCTCLYFKSTIFQTKESSRNVLSMQWQLRKNSLPERFAKFVLPIGTLHLLRHHLKKLIKFDGTVSILIHLVHHVAQFRLWKESACFSVVPEICKMHPRYIRALNDLPDGLWPRDRMTTPNSAIVIVPSSSLSKSMNASLNSEITEHCRTDISLLYSRQIDSHCWLHLKKICSLITYRVIVNCKSWCLESMLYFYYYISILFLLITYFHWIINFELILKISIAIIHFACSLVDNNYIINIVTIIYNK